MASSPSNPKRRGFEPLVRRVLAVDAGSRVIRLLLMERRFSRLRVLRQETLDLASKELSSAADRKSRVQLAMAQSAHPPIALTLSQEAVVSQLVELPAAADDEARRLIQNEIVKMGGVGNSPIVYDFARISAGEGRQQCWVTFCREEEIQSRIGELGLDDHDFQEITTTANALLTAWHVAQPATCNAVLVHAGAQNTTLVVIRQGFGVFASSFPMGGDFFTRAIVRLKGTTFEAAEALKCSTNLLQGSHVLPGFADVVEGWTAELKQQLGEWQRQYPGATGDLSDYELIATGSVFRQPGLLSLLRARSGLKFNPWPSPESADSLKPEPGFEVAFGTALQALGEGTQVTSLLPSSRQLAWKRRLRRQQLDFANALAAAACALALLLGIWSKAGFIRQKEVLLGKVESAIATVQTNAVLRKEWQASFEGLRPLFARQQATVDTLRSLALLQQVRSNAPFWFVLVADQKSYFAQEAPTVSTNQIGPPQEPDGIISASPAAVSDPSPARPGLIAELCIPDGDDGGHDILSQLVNRLKAEPQFARVDTLPSDLRRNFADPKVVLAQRHFPLSLEFASTEFEPQPEPKPVRPVVPAAGTPSRTGPWLRTDRAESRNSFTNP